MRTAMQIYIMQYEIRYQKSDLKYSRSMSRSLTLRTTQIKESRGQIITSNNILADPLLFYLFKNVPLARKHKREITFQNRLTNSLFFLAYAQICLHSQLLSKWWVSVVLLVPQLMGSELYMCLKVKFLLSRICVKYSGQEGRDCGHWSCRFRAGCRL